MHGENLKAKNYTTHPRVFWRSFQIKADN